MWPFIFKTENWGLPTYFVINTLAACIALIWAKKRATRLNLSPTIALDLTLVVMVTSFLGARLTHVLYEAPTYYFSNPFDVFKFWQGGFVYYGGLFFGFIFGVLYIRSLKLPISEWFDFAAPIIAGTYSLGRIGCWLAGCCYGRFCDLPWATRFPRGVEAPSGIPLHPTQLYAAIGEAIILAIIVIAEKRKGPLVCKAGDVFYLWGMLHSVNRIIMETFRDDFRGYMLGPISISMVLSGLLLLICATMYLRNNIQKN